MSTCEDKLITFDDVLSVMITLSMKNDLEIKDKHAEFWKKKLSEASKEFLN